MQLKMARLVLGFSVKGFRAGGQNFFLRRQLIIPLTDTKKMNNVLNNV